MAPPGPADPAIPASFQAPIAFSRQQSAISNRRSESRPLWRTHLVPCNLCGASDFVDVYPSSLPTSLDQHLDELCACTSSAYGICEAIMRCRQCGLVCQNPQPQPDDLISAYTSVIDGRYDEEREGRIHTFRQSLRELEAHLPVGRLLDVGCHLGFFLEVAAEAGWQAQGLEPSRWAAETARRRGLGVRRGTLDDWDWEGPGQPFDAVTLWDVIEHLADPLGVLRQIHGFLRPGGVVALSTMDVDAPVARLLGRRWPWYMQMHLYYFSRRTLSALVERAGYDVLEIRRHRRIVRAAYLASRLEAWLGRWHQAPVRALELLGLANRLVGIDLGDIVTLYARKPDCFTDSASERPHASGV